MNDRQDTAIIELARVLTDNTRETPAPGRMVVEQVFESKHEPEPDQDTLILKHGDPAENGSPDGQYLLWDKSAYYVIFMVNGSHGYASITRYAALPDLAKK